jgi:hypothetical protein
MMQLAYKVLCNCSLLNIVPSVSIPHSASNIVSRLKRLLHHSIRALSANSRVGRLGDVASYGVCLAGATSSYSLISNDSVLARTFTSRSAGQTFPHFFRTNTSLLRSPRLLFLLTFAVRKSSAHIRHFPTTQDHHSPP